MQGALESVDGVEVLDVDYDAKTAKVRMDASKVKPAQLVSALEDAGFGGEVAK